VYVTSIFLSVTINDSFSVGHSRVKPLKLNQKVHLKIKVARAIVQSLELGNTRMRIQERLTKIYQLHLKCLLNVIRTSQDSSWLVHAKIKIACISSQLE